MRNFRTTLLIEGVTWPDGRIWAPGSVELPADGVELPIINPRSHPALPTSTVGWMRNFARIPLGAEAAIVADVELWAEAAGRRLSAAARSSATSRSSEHGPVFTRYELEGAALLPEDAVPCGWLHQRPIEATL